MSAIDSYYTATVHRPPRPRLEGRAEADCAVVGGGLAGLTTALWLARAGWRVAVLEARQVGFGASGRNGGVVSPAFACGAEKIEARVGPQAAEALHRLTIEGVERVRATIAELGITEARPVPGLLNLRRYDQAQDLKDWVADWQDRYAYPMTYLDGDEIAGILATRRYRHGVRDPQAMHMHPLAYVLGIAREIERLGGAVYEESPVLRHDLGAQARLYTQAGMLQARQVVFAMGGYTTALVPALRRAILPIATYMIETEASPRLAEAISTSEAVLDDRRNSDYYRLVDGGAKLLWGGRISVADASPQGVARQLRRAMGDVYPQLADIGIARAWSGWMGYARHLMPQIGRLAPGAWHITAFGGHGLNTTAVGAKVLAEAMLGESDRIALFAPWSLAWAGGPFGLLAAQATYWGLQLQDRWRERGL